MEVLVRSGQSLLDIALQTAGALEAAFLISVSSGVPLTDTLTDGEKLPIVKEHRREVVTSYKADAVFPATALTEEDYTTLAQEGIEFMGIEIDFIIS